MYFEDFQKFLYDFDIKGERKVFLITDITRNIRFRRDVLANILSYDEYDIVDGESPEIIAEKFYGDPQYHWVIMLANERYDYRADFPLTYSNLSSYVTDKYADQVDAIHHYEDSAGNIVYQTADGAVSVSNRQFEDNVNESKRRIKIVSPSLLATILQNYKDFI